MFSPAARIAAIAALGAASLACSAPTFDDPDPPVEIEVPLDLTIDEVSVRHGTVRIAATMGDGSPDVSMWLGPDCASDKSDESVAPREVGHGIATSASFVWRLTKDELARAMTCNLVVKVRAVDDEGTRVRRVASVNVSITFAIDPSSDDDDPPQLRAQASKDDATRLSFRSTRRATRLHAAGALIGAEPDDDDDESPGGPYESAFEVHNRDVAQCLVSRRPVTVLGTQFIPTLTVGNVAFDGSEPEPVADSETTISGDS